MKSRIGPNAALLVVDIQNGFISEKNQLPVSEGKRVVPLINKLLPHFRVRLATQDWHPPGHGSFASAHPGKRPFDRGRLGGVPQTFWPDHCVQGTHGAEFDPDLDQRWIQTIIRKGIDPAIDSYSAFADNAGRNPTGLVGYLNSLSVEEIFVAGLALDYCVRATAMDARHLLPKARVSVVLDATRPVDPRTGETAKREMQQCNIHLITSREMFSRPASRRSARSLAPSRRRGQ